MQSHRGKRGRGAWLVAALAVTAQWSQQALATFAFDRASNSAYAAEAGGAWKGANPTAQENPAGTDNGGSGFGIWDFGGGVHSTVFSPYGNLNHFIDGVDFPASVYNDLGAPAFALTNSNLVSGAATIASRPFAVPMAINDTFSVNFDTPALWDTSGGSFYFPTVNIEFFNSSGAKTFDIEAGKHSVQGEFPWRYDHAGGTNVSTGIDPDATSDGSRLAFHLTSSTAGTLTFDVNGADQVSIPITLMSGAPAGIRFSLYANSSGNGSTSSPAATGQRELFFDDIHVTAPVFNGEWIRNDSVSNWSSPSSWSGGVPDQPGASAFFGSAITAPRTVNVDGPRMVRALMFENAFSYTLVGSAITIDTLIPSDGLVQVFSGSHTISAPLILNKNTTFTTSDAAAKLTLANLTATGRDITKTGPGTLEVNRVRASTVTVSNGTLKVTPAADPFSVSSHASVSQVNSLDIPMVAGRRLDLTNTKMIVTNMAIGTWNGSAYTGVTGMIQNGRGDGSWNGSGIVTSMSDATSGILTTLAVALAEDVGYAGGTFAGQSVVAGDVLVMYTWGGDAELDGDLDGDDYFWIDSNVGNSGSVFGFHFGDFDLNGLINGDDYFIIDSNIAFAQTQPNFPTGGGVGGTTSVPEPGIGGAVVFGVGLLCRRRRRLCGIPTRSLRGKRLLAL